MYINGRFKSDNYVKENIMVNNQLIKELESYISRHQLIPSPKMSESPIPDSVVAESRLSYLKKARIASSKPTKELDLFTNMDVVESAQAPPDIKDYININREPKFNEVLFDFIDTRQLDDADVYKKANIDRRLFSKIRTVKNYKPKKTTALALGLALELDNKDMDKLLSSAGFILGKSDTLDLIIHFCLEKKIYNILEVNSMLDYFSINIL